MINTLAIDPQTPETLYAGTAGVFKSTNGGASWTAINTGIAGMDGMVPGVNAIDIDPKSPATLYAGTDIGVFKSTNGGANWIAVNPGFPSYPQRTLYGGFFLCVQSTNTSWTEINTGLSKHSSVYALAIDPHAPETLYGGIDSGLFKSTNGGASWTAIKPYSLITFHTLAIDPQTPETLYAGGYFYCIFTCPPPPPAEVYKTINGGANWTAINTGLTASSLFALVIDPQTPEILYAGTDNGVFKMQQAETIVTPDVPSGPGSGTKEVIYTYSTEGSSSNFGHSIQYFFDWGDGTNSGWLPVGTTSASKS